MIDAAFLARELGGLYGAAVLQDMAEGIRLYELYDGKGQRWPVAEGLDYRPTRKRTNYIKKLVKAEARFLFGRMPEITVKPVEDGDIAPPAAALEAVQAYLDEVFRANNLSDRLIKAARDCFIGKRVALKLWAAPPVPGQPAEPVRIQFRPSLEFVFETEDDDSDRLKKVVFFYETTNEIDRAKQRVWRQRFEMVGGRCLLTETVHDGYGVTLETRYDAYDTGLAFLPVYVIVNDGLSGDAIGESDVAEIEENQAAYNRLTSDDVDALRFSMFPQKVAVDASAASLEGIRIQPGALIDLQTDAAVEGKQANMSVLESGFTYSERFEAAINRVKGDMFDLLSVPNVGLEQLRGLMQSGKSMRALYWDLICRCEEKWATWEPALQWMCKAIVDMAAAFGLADLPTDGYRVHIEHLYPIPEDEEEERAADLAEVVQQARSRKGFIEKWQGKSGVDPEVELRQIAKEKALLEEAFAADGGGMEGDGSGVYARGGPANGAKARGEDAADADDVGAGDAGRDGHARGARGEGDAGKRSVDGDDAP